MSALNWRKERSDLFIGSKVIGHLLLRNKIAGTDYFGSGGLVPYTGTDYFGSGVQGVK